MTSPQSANSDRMIGQIGFVLPPCPRLPLASFRNLCPSPNWLRSATCRAVSRPLGAEREREPEAVKKSVGRRKRLPHKDGSPSTTRWDRRFRLSIRQSARFLHSFPTHFPRLWPNRRRAGKPETRPPPAAAPTPSTYSGSRGPISRTSRPGESPPAGSASRRSGNGDWRRLQGGRHRRGGTPGKEPLYFLFSIVHHESVISVKACPLGRDWSPSRGIAGMMKSPLFSGGFSFCAGDMVRLRRAPQEISLFTPPGHRLYYNGSR